MFNISMWVTSLYILYDRRHSTSGVQLAIFVFLSGNGTEGQECIITVLSLQEVWERHTCPPTEQRLTCKTVNKCRYRVH